MVVSKFYKHYNVCAAMAAIAVILRAYSAYTVQAQHVNFIGSQNAFLGSH